MLVRNTSPVEAHWAKKRDGRLVGLIVTIHRSFSQFDRYERAHKDPEPDGTEWVLEVGPDPVELRETVAEMLKEPEVVASHGYERFDFARYA